MAPPSPPWPGDGPLLSGAGTAGVLAGTDGGGLSGAKAPLRSAGRRRSRPLGVPGAALVTGVFSCFALFLCVYEFTRPGAFLGVYDGDDGVYLGAAVRLVDGVLPYRDFVLLHPPGIALLMAPIALVSHFTGTQVGLGLARVVTALVTAANVALIGVVLRRRRLATVAAGAAVLACYPVAVAADNTLFLEPYLVFFCLLGTALVFSSDGRVARRRLLAGGAAFGVAGVVKVWAIVPVAVLVVCLAPYGLAVLRRICAGVVLGFGVPAAAFFAAAPGAFFHDVVVTQFARGASGVAAVERLPRLEFITGSDGLGPARIPAHPLAVLVVVAYAALVVWYVARRGRTRPLEWFALGSAGAVALAELVPSGFYAHYGYFAAPFIALVAALSLDRMLAAAEAVAARRETAAPDRAVRRLRAGAVALVAVAAAAAVAPVFDYAESWMTVYTTVSDPAAALDRVIPPGSCVVSVDADDLLDADRFTPSGAGCPALDDAFGTWLSLDPAAPPPSPPPYPANLVGLWARWLTRADYLLYEQGTVKVPWTPALTAWFQRDYTLVEKTPLYEVYVNAHLGAAPGA